MNPSKRTITAKIPTDRSPPPTQGPGRLIRRHRVRRHDAVAAAAPLSPAWFGGDSSTRPVAHPGGET